MKGNVAVERADPGMAADNAVVVITNPCHLSNHAYRYAMTPYYQSPDGKITLYLGDCLDVFPKLSGLWPLKVKTRSLDALVTRMAERHEVR